MKRLWIYRGGRPSEKYFFDNYGFVSFTMIKSPSPNLSPLLPPGSGLVTVVPLLFDSPPIVFVGATVLKKRLKNKNRRFMMPNSIFVNGRKLIRNELKSDAKVWTHESTKKDRNPDFNTCRLKAGSPLLPTFWREQVNELFEPQAFMQGFSIPMKKSLHFEYDYGFGKFDLTFVRHSATAPLNFCESCSVNHFLDAKMGVCPPSKKGQMTPFQYMQMRRNTKHSVSHGFCSLN